MIDVLPPIDSFGPEYPALRELISRAHRVQEEFGESTVEVTSKEQADIYAEMDKWAKTHSDDLGKNPHRYSGYGAIQIRVVNE